MNKLFTVIANALSSLDNKKVDKVDGKGLSTKDYTEAEQTKLAGVEENATNVTEDTVSGWGFTKSPAAAGLSFEYDDVSNILEITGSVPEATYDEETNTLNFTL